MKEKTEKNAMAVNKILASLTSMSEKLLAIEGKKKELAEKCAKIVGIQGEVTPEKVEQWFDLETHAQILAYRMGKDRLWQTQFSKIGDAMSKITLKALFPAHPEFNDLVRLGKQLWPIYLGHAKVLACRKRERQFQWNEFNRLKELKSQSRAEQESRKNAQFMTETKAMLFMFEKFKEIRDKDVI